MERKLTAILSADVRGYSRLMGDDLEGLAEASGICISGLVAHCVRAPEGQRGGPLRLNTGRARERGPADNPVISRV